MKVSAYVEVKEINDQFEVVVHTRRADKPHGSQVVCTLDAGACAARRAVWLQNLFAEIELAAREDVMEKALKIARGSSQPD